MDNRRRWLRRDRGEPMARRHPPAHAQDGCDEALRGVLLHDRNIHGAKLVRLSQRALQF